MKLNPKQIIEGYFNLVFKKEYIEEIAKIRLDICKNNSCGYYNKDKNICNSCGCLLKAKTRALSAECPELKWKAIKDVK